MRLVQGQGACPADDGGEAFGCLLARLVVLLPRLFIVMLTLGVRLGVSVT